METFVIYKYRAPGAPQNNDQTITSETKDLGQNELRADPHVVGETVTLVADDPDEFGEGPREYKVLSRWSVAGHFVRTGVPAPTLTVTVTDPDA